MFSEQIKITINDYATLWPDTPYKFSIKNLSIDSKAKILTARSIGLTPLFDKGRFSKNMGYQTDRFDFSCETLSATNFPITALFTSNTLKVGKLITTGFHLGIFRDKTIDRKKDQLFKALPVHLLQRMGLYVKIDTTLLKGRVVYEEDYSNTITASDKHTAQGGQIILDSLYALGCNITNDRSLINTGLRTNIKASAFLMGNSGLLETDFSFDLTNADGLHTITGKMDKMALPLLNPLLEEAAHVRIRSGAAKTMRFRFKAYDDYALGKMDFKYNNLEILFLGEQAGGTAIQRFKRSINAGLMSFIANNFVIVSDNPKVIFLRKGKIFYRRNKQRSIFNYWTNILMSGVRSSIKGIGMNANKPTRADKKQYGKIKYNNLAQ